MRRPTPSSSSPVRLVVLGALLLWVLTPLLLGGLITVVVRTQAHGHVGPGLGAALLVWGLVALLVLLVGFACIIGGVFAWWRARQDVPLVETREDSASD